MAHLDDPVGPRELLGFVADEDLEFDPGTEYHYSNSDNIVVALMAAKVTGHRYERVLRDEVLRPLGLRETSLPSGVEMPTPYIRGYYFDDQGAPVDVSELFAAGYAWASGGIVSTPLEQNRFIRGYVGRTLFGAGTQAEQFDFIAGGSEPTGPGRNAAGLAIFRYRTRCGTMFGQPATPPGTRSSSPPPATAAARSWCRSTVRPRRRCDPTSSRTCAGCSPSACAPRTSGGSPHEDPAKSGVLEDQTGMDRIKFFSDAAFAIESPCCFIPRRPERRLAEARISFFARRPAFRTLGSRGDRRAAPRRQRFRRDGPDIADLARHIP